MQPTLSYEALMQLHAQQLASWPEVKERYDDLSKALRRTVPVDDVDVTLQYNPARIRSTAAKVDAQSLAERPCFLCHRPSEQLHLPWRSYEVLVNPYPILPHHFTIISREHQPQSILNRIGDMIDLARALEGFVVFYNGPHCGASAPDHAHFQAGDLSGFPLVRWLEHDERLPYPVFVLDSAYQFLRLYNTLTVPEGQYEPMLNVLAWSRWGRVIIAVIPRRRHRPSCYGTGQGQLLLSPAGVDLGGQIAVPRRCDFDNLDAQALYKIYDEVCITHPQAQAALVSIISTLHISH